MPPKFKTSAPGSLMLLGEYAVLHGKQAIVCAVNKRIHLTLALRADHKIYIQSDLHAPYQTNLHELKIERPFQFVLAVLKKYQRQIKQGVDLEIHTDFSDQIGFGSSAAVTVATIAAVTAMLDVALSPLKILKQGREIVRTVQGGVGSGADVAASVYGGITWYQTQPLLIENFAFTLPLSVLYSGFKTKTADAINTVQSHFVMYPRLLANLHAAIGQCAAASIPWLRQKEWKKLGEVMNIQQGLMEALGVSLPLLRDMIDELRQQPTIFGAKISGSGLGDCVVGLGQLAADYVYPKNQNVKRIPVEITLQGVNCEKIGDC